MAGDGGRHAETHSITHHHEHPAQATTPPGAGTATTPAEARAVLADFAQHDHATLRAAARLLIAQGATRSERTKGRAWLAILGED